ncbi:hypothetical protein ACF0H5_015284 [Mactra antiquata]
MILHICCLLILMVSLGDTLPTYAACKDENVKEGQNNFFPASDCTKYKQCSNDGVGLPYGEYMNCSFPTYWNQDVLTCMNYDKVPCQNEYCQNKPDGDKRAGHGNCRSYWSCSNGKSVPKCCPNGQWFDGTDKNICRDNLPTDTNPCYVDCLNDKATPPVNSTLNITTTTAVPEVCNKKPHDQDPKLYIEDITGHPELTRPCSPGTIFNQTACNCVDDMITDVIRCVPELVLNFVKDLKDSSGKGIVLTTENVQLNTTTQSAWFNGNNSRMESQRFNNIEHLPKLVIDIQYNSNHAILTANQSIMSNDDCLPFSIDIKEDADFVYFSAGTTKDLKDYESVVKIPQGQHPIKNATFKLMDELLTGTVNGVSDSVKAPGFLINVHCGLSIGYSKIKQPFAGYIINLQVFFCNPETPSDNTFP